MRASELGIELPEADPTHWVGQLSGDTPIPVEVVMPEGFPLSRCYRLDADVSNRDETAAGNVHLLAGLGKHESPFVPVFINRDYNGYSWADLPVIDKVEVAVGNVLHETWIWGGKLICVDSLFITAHARDGKVFASPVCMAVTQTASDDASSLGDEQVHVTPEAQAQLAPSDIWYHFGGWREDYDTYDTEERAFHEEVDRFWANLVGPDEHLRRGVLSSLAGIQLQWQSVTVTSDGVVTVHFVDGSRKTLKPPLPGNPQAAE